MKTKLIIAGIVLVLILLMVTSSSGNTSSSVKVKYFYSPMCPHCRNFMDEWEKFVTMCTDKATCEKINCMENSQACANIVGVPHVVFVSGTTEVVYSGERTADALSSFLSRFNQ